MREKNLSLSLLNKLSCEINKQKTGIHLLHKPLVFFILLTKTKQNKTRKKNQKSNEKKAKSLPCLPVYKKTSFFPPVVVVVEQNRKTRPALSCVSVITQKRLLYISGFHLSIVQEKKTENNKNGYNEKENIVCFIHRNIRRKKTGFFARVNSDIFFSFFDYFLKQSKRERERETRF